MSRWLAAAVLALAVAGGALAEEPPAAEEVVLRTTMGDVVIALDAARAPGHAAQFRRLVALGVYETVPVVGIHRGLLLHFADASERRLLLTEAQAAAIHPLRAESSPPPYRRGDVLMARAPQDPDSAQTSILILLQDGVDLGGPYTVFGRVVWGQEVLDAMNRVDVGPQARPLEPIEILRAELAPASATPASLRLRGPVPQLERWRSAWPAWTWGIGALAVALGLMAFLLSRWGWPRWVGSCGLLAVLVGAFLWLPIGVAYGRAVPWIGAGVFADLIVLFRLMALFEDRRGDAG